MGLFGKKNKNVDENVEAAEVEVKKKPEKPVKKKGKKNELLKIFDESVWESVHEDFKANKQFIIQDRVTGETKYIGLLFDTNLVGGFTGKSAKKDESKGSIIEAVRTGRIKTYIRSEMLMDDLFIIIPDEETIDNMDEFVILTDIPYTICSVDDDGMIMTETENGTDDEDDPEIQVTFDQVQKIIATGDSVYTLLPAYSQGADDAASFDRGSDTDVEDLSDLGDEISDLPEDLEDIPDDDLGDDLDDLGDDLDNLDDAEDVSGDTPVDDLDDIGGDSVPTDVPDDAGQPADMNNMGADPNGYAQPQNNVSYDDGSDGGYDEYNSDVGADVINDFVKRQYYSEDLELEISTEAFDQKFMHGNSYLPFNEDRGTGWLNEYLSNIAKDANTRMERMHNENLFRMRERYMRLIQDHCSVISQSLSIADDSTQYGRLRFAIEQHKADSLDLVDKNVTEKRVRLEEQWEKTLESVRNEAAAQAEREYVNRHGRRHEQDLVDLETREKDEIERDYQMSISNLNKDRKREAKKLLELAVSETLNEMSQAYLRVLREEKKEYIRLQNEMTRFIDDNRKDEKARIEYLAEENRQVKKANEVRRDFTAKIKAMSAEMQMKQTMLQADIDRMNSEHEAALESSRTEWANRIEEERAKSQNLQRQVDDLLEKYAALDDRKKNEYASRISELEMMNKSKDEDMEHLVEMHKRSNVVTVLLIVAILLAAIGVGFMFGSIMNVRKTSQIEQQGIYQQYSAPAMSQPEQDPNLQNGGAYAPEVYDQQ